MIDHRRTLFFSLPLILALALTLTACGDRSAEPAATVESAQDAPEIELDVPFVPTPHEIVARMLEMGAVGVRDHLIDLGSGDGRIVIAAVRDRGARSAEGIDLDPQRVEEAQQNAIAAGVADRTRFEHGDLFAKDFSAATVLTLYLTQDINLRLRPRILDTLNPGSRVVSHVFDMGAWVPDQHATIGSVNIYAWTVPARVEGRWEVSRAGESSGTMDFEQSFQMIGGIANLDGKQLPIIRGRVDGDRLSFQVGEETFTGRIAGDRMTLSAADAIPWQAVREPGQTNPSTSSR